MKVAIIMGSKSDLDSFKSCFEILDYFGIDYDVNVVSAHRCPRYMFDFASNASNVYDVIIAGAGGAAHLPGMVASLTTLPVIGVPIASKHLNGLDSLYSIVQMPGGVPVATMAIGCSGAKNAGLMAVRIFSIYDANLKSMYQEYVDNICNNVMSEVLS